MNPLPFLLHRMIEEGMPKSLGCLIVTLWMILAVVESWSAIAFAIAVFSSLTLGLYLLVDAIVGSNDQGQG